MPKTSPIDSFSRFSRTPTCDRQTQTDTDTVPWLVPRMHSIARWKRSLYGVTRKFAASKFISAPGRNLRQAGCRLIYADCKHTRSEPFRFTDKLESKLPSIEDRGQIDRFTIVADSNPWPWLMYNLDFNPPRAIVIGHDDPCICKKRSKISWTRDGHGLGPSIGWVGLGWVEWEVLWHCSWTL